MALSDQAGYFSRNGTGCAKGVTNTGKSLFGSIMDVAAVAVAGYNTAMAIQIADLQYEIAKDYLDIAKWWRRFYNDVYRPLEDIELAEAWALEPEEPMYDITIGRHKNYARLQYRGIADKTIQCTSPYCTGLRGALLKDVMTAEATTLAALSNMGYRSERAYVEARNAVRWERRREVLNRGRNMIAGNINFSNMAYGIFGNLGSQAQAGAAGAMRYLGYSWNKNETQYPMTYVSGGQGATMGVTQGADAPGSVMARTGKTARQPGRVSQPASVQSTVQQDVWERSTSGYMRNTQTGELRKATQDEMAGR